MKGYLSILVVTALILLLLPLGALPRQDAAVGPAPAPFAPPDASSTLSDNKNHPGIPPSSNSSSSGEDVFRILCGKEVVTLTEREFLIRTLAFEMDPAYHTEALKAQAVAAYTYYGRRRQAQKEKPDPALHGADFAAPVPSFPGEYTAEKRKERWGKAYEAYEKKICAAVDAVKGYTITKDDKLIDACYFSISNGCTESASVVWGTDIPYLQSVASPGDRLAPKYETKTTLSAEEVRKALSKAEKPPKLPKDPAKWFGKPSLSKAGTVTSIPVGDVVLSGTTLRQLLGLRSASIAIAYGKEGFTFTVRGYGHGVGMSQYGADYLARQGYSFKEILQYYYTDVTVTP